VALRALAVFWTAVLVLLGGGAAILQALGPPRLQKADAVAVVPAAVPAAAPIAAPAPLPSAASTTPQAVETVQNNQPGTGLRAGWDGRIPGPNTALLEPAPDFKEQFLPRRGPDGLAPMQAYARPFDRSDTRPRIAIVVGGIGLSNADSLAAIDQLPPEIDLALSAYADPPRPLADHARERGHELLLSLPMEPEGYPMNDEGPHALLTGAAPEDNERNLEWTLSRFDSYAGVTGASDGMRGERFAGMAVPFGIVARELSSRGLFYVDARPDAPPTPDLAGCSVNLVLDQPPARASIEAQLARLESLAHDRGSAVGLVGPPLPLVVETIVAWARGLEARGIVLAPASAVSHPPEPAQ
jgi:polysaccharide deacetylase 2 family uncharacterized protein YibQ